MNAFLARLILAAAACAPLAGPSVAAASAAPPQGSYEERFDSNVQAFISGVVSNVSCRHSVLSFRVISAHDGSEWKMKVPWLSFAEAGESGSIGLVKGADITVAGWPAKNGANKLAVVRMMINGKAIESR